LPRPTTDRLVDDVVTPSLSWYSFLHDFIDPGIDTAIDELEATGATGANMAMVYHTARDLLPTNPRRRMRFMTGGTHYYQADRSLYSDRAPAPRVDPELGGSDPARDVVEALANRGLRFDAWVVFGHNSSVGLQRPDLSQRNAFDDVMATDLCPANPIVRERAISIVFDVCRYRPSAIVAESLHFHGLRHGYHHERYLLELGPLAELCLSLCFCEYCCDSARAAGIDVVGVRRFAQDAALEAFDGRGRPDLAELTLDGLRAHLDGQLLAYVEHRCAVVASLAAEAADAAALHGVGLVFLDPSGASKGYADGHPTDAAPAESGWQFGVSTRGLAGNVAAIGMLGYAREVARIESDLDAYQDAIGSTDTVVRLSLRPSHPDLAAAAELAAKLEAATSRGVGIVDLYHFGLVPQASRDMVRAAALGTDVSGSL
jgi:hypothetical protein